MQGVTSKRRLSGHRVKYDECVVANPENLQIVSGTQKLSSSWIGWEYVLIEKQLLASGLDQMNRHAKLCPHNNLLLGLNSEPYGNIKLNCKS